jgi:hypothetical protein
VTGKGGELAESDAPRRRPPNLPAIPYDSTMAAHTMAARIAAAIPHQNGLRLRRRGRRRVEVRA